MKEWLVCDYNQSRNPEVEETKEQLCKTQYQLALY